MAQCRHSNQPINQSEPPSGYSMRSLVACRRLLATGLPRARESARENVLGLRAVHAGGELNIGALLASHSGRQISEHMAEFELCLYVGERGRERAADTPVNK